MRHPIRITLMAAMIVIAAISHPSAGEGDPGETDSTAEPPPGKPWPQKGEMIYLSISLPRPVQNTIPPSLQWLGVSPPALPLDRLLCNNTAYCWYFDPPCEPLKVYKSKPHKPLLLAYDPYNLGVTLKSDFTPWIHSSASECEEAARTADTPPLRYHGYALHITSPDAPSRPDSASVSIGGPFKPAGIVDVDAVPPQAPSKED